MPHSFHVVRLGKSVVGHHRRRRTGELLQPQQHRVSALRGRPGHRQDAEVAIPHHGRARRQPFERRFEQDLLAHRAGPVHRAVLGPHRQTGFQIMGHQYAQQRPVPLAILISSRRIRVCSAAARNWPGVREAVRPRPLRANFPRPAVARSAARARPAACRCLDGCGRRTRLGPHRPPLMATGTETETGPRKFGPPGSQQGERVLVMSEIPEYL